MSSPGLLRVGARYADGAIHGLAVDLQRPPVTRLFIGQHPEVVLKTLPYVYTLCAAAQRAAAQATLAAAGGLAPRALNAGELWTEVLHENFWRLLLDWPAALGLAPARAEFAAWRNLRHGSEALGATRRLREETLAPLAAACLQQLGDDALPAPGLPPLDPAAWLAAWRAGTALPAPQQPGSLAAALRQRLAEVEAAIAGLAGALPFPVAAAGGDGWGVGQTLTARGVLTHAVRLDGEQVAAYRVWAPTDCHFADAAGLQALLAGRPVASATAARRLVEQAVLALDPCLPFVVELPDA